MKSKNIEIAFCLIAMFALLIGCDTNQTTALKPASQPNLSLHKPKTFPIAIQRLKEIHATLIGDGEFPAPKKIEYVEVIHGEGAAGHSHYYSAEDYEADGTGEHDGHDEEDEKVKHRSMEVGLRKELADIAGWLPKIAAKSSLNETDWNSVKTISGRLIEINSGILTQATDGSFREAWKQKSEEIESMLGELQKYSDSEEAK